MGISYSFSIFDIEFESPSNYSEYEVNGIENWETTKRTTFLHEFVDLTLNEYLNLSSDYLIEKIYLNNEDSYGYSISLYVEYEDINKYFLFQNKEYIGIIFIKNISAEPETYTEIGVKYIINCDSI